MSAEPEAEAHTPPIRLVLEPEAPEAGMEFTLTAEIDPEALPEATDLVILDDCGKELGRADLVETDEGLVSEPLALKAPLQAGEHLWKARLIAETGDDAPPAPVAVALPLRVKAHPVVAVAWGLPPALSPGESFTFQVGLKCPCGCDSSGWPFTLSDGKGRKLHEGRVGDTPWTGTEGLHYAEITLAAPKAEGTETWEIVSDPPEAPAAHTPGRAEVRLVTLPAPEVTITVVVTEAATGAPVPRAKVVVHPYRALAGEDGIALLRVPRGRYTIQVSGRKYFASQTEGDVEEDVTISAELEIDRDFTDADAWA
jgi:hypothetical protein